MQLSSTLTWLVDAASASPGAERFLAELGTRLMLPPWLEPRRSDIERRLPPINLV